MTLNCLVFHTSRKISSSPAAFLFLIIQSTELSFSSVNGPSLMSNCLLIILVICSCVTFDGFSSRVWKCCFDSFIRSCWFVAFILALAELFFLLTSFIVYHAILDCQSSTEFLILFIWCCMYSVRSFRYMLANSFCTFFSFRAFALVGYFLLHLEAVFTFFSNRCLPRDSKFSSMFCWYVFCCYVYVGVDKYSSFEVRVSVFSCSASNLFLNDITYLSLISLLLRRPSHRVRWSLFGWRYFVGSIVFLPGQFGDRRTLPRKRSKLRNSLQSPISCL